MKVAAIDIGYGWTKAKSGNLIFKEPSVIGDMKQLHDENKKRGYIIFDKHFVGQLAIKHSDITYYSLNDSKANTWTTEILMKTALAYLKAYDTHLVTGLPIDFYFKQKNDMENLIYKINNQKVWLEIIGEGKFQEDIYIKNHKIVPQPLGAAMDYLLDANGDWDKKDEAKKRLLVVDWGRFTLDLLILDGMEIHKASSSPPDMGIESAYNLLRRYLRETVGSFPKAFELDQVVVSGEYQGLDVSALVERAFEKAVVQIQLEIEGLNTRFHKHILVGGQAERLDKYLDLPDKVIGHQLSNLYGYEKIGMRSWGRG